MKTGRETSWIRQIKNERRKQQTGRRTDRATRKCRPNNLRATRGRAGQKKRKQKKPNTHTHTHTEYLRVCKSQFKQGGETTSSSPAEEVIFFPTGTTKATRRTESYCSAFCRCVNMSFSSAGWFYLECNQFTRLVPHLYPMVDMKLHHRILEGPIKFKEKLWASSISYDHHHFQLSCYHFIRFLLNFNHMGEIRLQQNIWKSNQTQWPWMNLLIKENYRNGY